MYLESPRRKKLYNKCKENYGVEEVLEVFSENYSKKDIKHNTQKFY